MYRKISWWYWLITVGLIAAGLSGWSVGFYLAISLCTVQVWHFAVLKRSMSAFPVQLRLAYTVLLVCGLWEPLRFLYWIQLIGTSAMVLVDYCLLARILSPMPWNLREPLSSSLIIRTFFSRPVRGNILQGLPKERLSDGHA